MERMPFPHPPFGIYQGTLLCHIMSVAATAQEDGEADDEPDEDLLEDGQDQSPQEMERLKQLRREQEEADLVRLPTPTPPPSPADCTSS